MATTTVISKESALNIIKSRKEAVAPGLYKNVKVTQINAVSLMNSTARTALEARNITHIANFNLITPYQTLQALTHFKAGDYNQAVNQQMSSSIRKTDYCPSKNEYVDVQVGEIVNKEGETILVIQSIMPAKAVEARAIDMSMFDDEATVGVSADSDLTPVNEEI